MAILRVDDFRGKMAGGGARANLFEVNVNFPGIAGGDTELTNFMCKAASLPGATTGVVSTPFRGRIVKFPGDRTFEPFNMTVYNDTNFTIRDSFQRWFNAMNTHFGNVGLVTDNAGYGTYLCDININQLLQDGSIAKKYTLRNCFPSSISEIGLDYAQTDAIEEFSVVIEYDFWSDDTVQ